MKLFYSPNSPYARKTRLAVRYLDLRDRVDEEDVSPVRSPDCVLLQYGPTRKVPSLLTDGGAFITESSAICRYLDKTAGAGVLYPEGDETILELDGLLTGLLDSHYWRSHEKRRPDDERSTGFIADEGEKAVRCYDALEKRVVGLGPDPTIVHLALGTVLGYSDFRHADDNWRDGRPNLAAWFKSFSKNDWFAETAPTG